MHATYCAVMRGPGVALCDRWSLVTILPGQVWGPPISIRHRNAESVKMMASMLNGAFYPAAPPIGARAPVHLLRSTVF